MSWDRYQNKNKDVIEENWNKLELNKNSVVSIVEYKYKSSHIFSDINSKGLPDVQHTSNILYQFTSKLFHITIYYLVNCTPRYLTV